MKNRETGIGPQPGTPGSPEDERLEAAVEWFMRLRSDEADVGELPEFERWLQADARNARAYRQVAAGWNEVGAHASSLVGDRRDALDHAQRTSVSQTGSGTPESAESRPGPSTGALAAQRRRRGGRRGLAVAASLAAALILFAGIGWTVLQSGTEYATGRGERRTLTLDDGTTVSLDASSRIRVDFEAAERRIHLRQGQARFDVAKDAARPFRVLARDRSVLALGTQFNVELVSDSVLVTLIEGKVAVGSRGLALPEALRQAAALAATTDKAAPKGAEAARPMAASGPVLLDPGQQLIVAEAGARLRTDVDVRRTMSWQNGELIFDDEPLSSAAARINRYATHAIVVDPSVAHLGISGVFKVGEPEAFVEAVASYFPVQVRRGKQEVHLSARR